MQIAFLKEPDNWDTKSILKGQILLNNLSNLEKK
jgi:hypothetical protein